MGKKLNGLFKAASQINSLLGLCARHFCLMFLSLLMSLSDARIIQESRPKEHNLSSGDAAVMTGDFSVKIQGLEQDLVHVDKK